MINKKEFDEERKECEEVTHIEEGITDPTLIEIDKLYGAADALSMKHAKKYHDKLLYISIIAPFVVFFFILYEATEQHGLIFVVTILLLLLYYVYSHGDEDHHEKYLEYRVLAESLRVQYFVSKAGISEKVIDILPWFTYIRIPLVKNVLSKLPTIETGKKERILDCWIRDQMKYHDRAHRKSLDAEGSNKLYERIALFGTIIVYIIALIFEISMMIYCPFDLETAHLVRVGFKISVGTATAITIFLSNYYGKLSLSNKIDEHLRMYWLYEKVERQIKQTKEEKDEQIIYLARQCLIENIIWYSHQKKNEPEFVLE
jgi:hypothetical protein